ncbi:MAG: LysM peptidoglycan-binding domain-containing protein [Gordonia sp. (in: high G+C Gram-positive bacteria)]|uniref:LysM peptidoglycan-binding domain-containing protein n=1 Tax=Gordonia sp. (in: high G+C Gram-positive bacteria) TaxID=84139 RepID=UPI0039E5D623
MSDTLNVGDSLSADQSLTSNNGKYTLTLQKDGNLVLNDGGKPVWASQTNGKKVERAVMQDDGNFVLYTGKNEGVWSTKTSGQNAKLVVQDDRNVVVVIDGQNAWATKTGDGSASAAPADAPAAPAAGGTTSYTIQSGDTLSGIAQQFLGDAGRYPEIAQLNNIENPDLIQAGATIQIPAK